MKIAIAGGHSSTARGAKCYIDEYDCDRAFVKMLIPALEEAGHTVVDCSNEKTTVKSELAEEVRLANNSNADIFIAIHFNAGGGTGTEVWYYSGNEQMRQLSMKMSKNIANALKLPNRGAKNTTQLYVIRKTNMPAILLETCFVDRREDAEAWNKAPWIDVINAMLISFGDKPKEEKDMTDEQAEQLATIYNMLTRKDNAGWTYSPDGHNMFGRANMITNQLKRTDNAGHDNPKGHDIFGRINIIEHNISCIMDKLGMVDEYRERDNMNDPSYTEKVNE